MKKSFYIILPFILVGCKYCSQLESEAQQGNYNASQDNAPVVEVLDVMNCPITPEIEYNVKVPQIYKTNNLRKRTGYAEFAKGHFIRISGILTDNFCVPIKNATIQIWQTDSNGRYKSIPTDDYLNDSTMYRKQSERFEDVSNDELADKNFTGSGSTITDNLGRFTFFSVMPGGPKPLVNFRIIHKDFNDIKTVMYFQSSDSADSLLIATKEGVVSYDEVQESIYKYNITLNGKNKYTNY